MEPASRTDVAFTIHLVTSDDSPEFTYLNHALAQSTIVGLDAEWKPNRVPATFPTVSLLQVACRLQDDTSEETTVFLIDLQSVQLRPVYELLSQLFVSPNVIKLGFRFKQDLVYLSHTFCERGGCSPGFDRVEPFVEITALYNFLQPKQLGRRQPKQSKSLAVICKEVLGITLSKELQCSDWSQRPLTEEQKIYAAADAHYLVKIFDVFYWKVVKEGNLSRNHSKTSDSDPGLKEICEISNGCNMVTRDKFCEALSMISTTLSESRHRVKSSGAHSMTSFETPKRVNDSLMWIAKKHGDKILLKDSDRMPKTSKKKAKMPSYELDKKEKSQETVEEWQGPPPWDVSSGGDGLPKFLCDVMVEGLAKHLRCVGVDAAVPRSKRPDTRELLDQAQKEGRVLLTRDAKLLRHGYLIKNQIYRIKNLLKNDQLLEVIETFQLTISEDQLMSRCTKCNGRFIQKPLTTEEAVEASKGFQVIPNCLFNKNLEFWQCMDCHQLYWEGTQYHNAVQKFIDVCKLNDQPEVVRSSK